MTITLLIIGTILAIIECIMVLVFAHGNDNYEHVPRKAFMMAGVVTLSAWACFMGAVYYA